MRKIICVLITMAFVLTLAGAALAQVAKTPHKAKMRNTPVASEKTAPAAKEKPQTEGETPKDVKPGHRTRHKSKAKKGAKKLTKRGKGKKKAGAHMITPQEIK